jgi:2'-5' RNA ligase
VRDREHIGLLSVISAGTIYLKMPDGYAVELYFDPALENQVLKIWNVLARRQISTQLIEIEARPHITLFARSSLESTKLYSVIKSFAAKQQTLAITLSAVGSFAAEDNVLFLAPTPTIPLLSLHEQFYEVLKKEGLEVAECYQPGGWVPHCTVAANVPKARIADAFSILRDFKLPLTGHVYDMGLVEFSPVREHYSFSMGAENK